METVRILNDIISKGGLMAACAKIYINDEDKAQKFLIECSEMCHSNLTKRYWGNKLIHDLIKYKKQSLKGL